MNAPKPYHLRTPHEQECARRRVVQRLSRGACVAQMARAYGVSRQTIYAWRDAAAADPQHGLVRKSKGRQCKLSEEQLARLRAMLLEGAIDHGFPSAMWTIGRVRELIVRDFGVNYARRSPWYVLRAILGFSPQRPERLAREGNSR